MNGIETWNWVYPFNSSGLINGELFPWLSLKIIKERGVWSWIWRDRQTDGVCAEGAD